MTQQKPYFHDAIILGKTGAMIYVVDEHGNKLSTGHHSVTWHGHEYFEAETGASDYNFTLDTDQIDPWGYQLTRQISLDDIVEQAEDRRIAALAAYLKAYDEVPESERVPFGEVNLD